VEAKELDRRLVMLSLEAGFLDDVAAPPGHYEGARQPASVLFVMVLAM